MRATCSAPVNANISATLMRFALTCTDKRNGITFHTSNNRCGTQSPGIATFFVLATLTIRNRTEYTSTAAVTRRLRRGRRRPARAVLASQGAHTPARSCVSTIWTANFTELHAAGPTINANINTWHHSNTGAAEIRTRYTLFSRTQ